MNAKMKKVGYLLILVALVVTIGLTGCKQPTDPIPEPTAPAAPSGLGGTVLSDTEINVYWTLNSTDETGVVLQIDTASDFSTATEEELAAGSTSFSATGLTAGTTYFFRVKAVNDVGSSAWTEALELMTGAPPSGSFAIDNGASYTRDTSVTLNSNITGAEEMRFRDGGGVWSSWIDYASSVNWTLPSGDGTKTVDAQYRDALGVTTDKSDVIVLDTVAPTYSSMYINGGNPTYTTSTSVVIYSSWSGGASEMAYRFSATGAWSSWISARTTQSITLPTGDGTKYVYVKLRDPAGNESIIRYDTIILDTVAPTVTTFYLRNGSLTTHALTTACTLEHAATGATQMRFSSNGTSWTSWYSYNSSDRSWTISGTENVTSYAYGEYRDAAGNVRRVTDGIKLDAIRRVRIYTQRIDVNYDGDSASSDPGELYWNAYAYYRHTSGSYYSSTITRRTSGTPLSINTGSSTNPGGYTIIQMPNTSSGWYRVYFQVGEVDGSTTNWSSMAISPYDYGDQWNYGTFSVYSTSSNSAYARATYRYTVQLYD
jgi:hypothetical protein